MILNKDKNFNKDGNKKSSWPVSLGNEVTRTGKNEGPNLSGNSLSSIRYTKGTHSLRPGQICDLNITALAPNNIGIDEYSFGFYVLIPNAKLGEKIKAKIIKIVNIKSKYAIATKVNTSVSSSKLRRGAEATLWAQGQREKGRALLSSASITSRRGLKVSDILTVDVEKIKKSDTSNYGIVKTSLKSPDGGLETSSNYYIIIPNIKQINNVDSINREKNINKVQILITKVKTKYAFGNLLSFPIKTKKQSPFSTTIKMGSKDFRIKKGSKMSLILPSEARYGVLPQATRNFFGGKGKSALDHKNIERQIKSFIYPDGINKSLESVNLKSNFFILKLKSREATSLNRQGFTSLPIGIGNEPALVRATSPVLLLIKKGLNAKAGDFVRIKVTNTITTVPLLDNKNMGGKVSFFFGKIIQLNPIAKSIKLKLVEHDLRLMIQNGLHFGDKALKCNAQMKKFIWHSSKGARRSQLGNFSRRTKVPGSEVKKKNLKTRNNNVLNVLKTRRCLNKVLNLIGKYAIKGKTFLFIGTKKPAAALISKASLLTKNSFFVNTKWLGGMLTNWKTILKSISKIRPILKEKQRVIKDILKKRQNIKTRLIERALLLRNKSKLILKKGRSLITYLKLNLKEKNKIFSTLSVERAPIGSEGQMGSSGAGRGQAPGTADLLSGRSYTRSRLTLKLTQAQFNLKRKNQALIEKRQQLLEKRKKVMLQSLSLKEKAFILLNSYKNVFNDLTITKQKLRELQFLLVLTNLINNISNSKGARHSQTRTSAGDTPNLPIYTLLNTPTKNNQQKKIDGTVLPKEILSIITQFAKSFTSPMKGRVTSFTLKNPEGALYKTSEQRPTVKSKSKDNTLVEKNNILLVNKVLIKLTQFIINIKPAINNLLKQLVDKTKQLVNQAQKIKLALKSVKVSLVNLLLPIKKKIVNELNYIKTQLNSEKVFAKVLKKKIKQLVSQKRFIMFLPKLRLLPVSQGKIIEIVQILMKKIVDPKLKYPIDSIYNQVLNTKLRTYSKKIVFDRKKKWERLEKYFGGIAKVLESTAKITLNNTTKNNKIVAILIGQQEEMNAVRECQKLGIKMIHIVDSNCNPTLADHIIPANDDSPASIKYVLSKILTRIRIAQKISVNITRFNIIKKKTQKKFR